MKLLGISFADLGILESPKIDDPPTRAGSVIGPTFTTKITKRSISLESLREIIKEVLIEGNTDWPQRQIVAQAAYEEWYFRKQREYRKNQDQNAKNAWKTKEKFKSNREKRIEQSREEFEKWLKMKIEQNKKESVRERDKGTKKRERTVVKVSKEVSDKAVMEWTKQKEKQLLIKKKLEHTKKEKEEKLNQQKMEKVLQAQKIYDEWKNKLIEEEKVKKENLKKTQRKLKEEMISRKNQAKSFDLWKEIKDEEIKIQKLETIKANKEAHELRTMKLAERSYEAEKAYEEWLEKIDERHKLKHNKVTISKPPVWTPV